MGRRPRFCPHLRRSAGFGLATIWLALAGCPDGVGAATYPPGELYGVPVGFQGEWMGEVASVPGIFEIDELGGGRYYGQFASDDHTTRYSLKMDHVMQGGAPTNLVRFSWQDGRGDRGLGWLLINREDSALTGTFGRGDEHTAGLGEWTFIRLE